MLHANCSEKHVCSVHSRHTSTDEDWRTAKPNQAKVQRLANCLKIEIVVRSQAGHTQITWRTYDQWMKQVSNVVDRPSWCISTYLKWIFLVQSETFRRLYMILYWFLVLSIIVILKFRMFFHRTHSVLLPRSLLAARLHNLYGGKNI